MHTLLASRPNVVASTRRDALSVNGGLDANLPKYALFKGFNIPRPFLQGSE